MTRVTEDSGVVVVTLANLVLLDKIVAASYTACVNFLELLMMIP